MGGRGGGKKQDILYPPEGKDFHNAKTCLEFPPPCTLALYATFISLRNTGTCPKYTVRGGGGAFNLTVEALESVLACTLKCIFNI